MTFPVIFVDGVDSASAETLATLQTNAKTYVDAGDAANAAAIAAETSRAEAAEANILAQAGGGTVPTAVKTLPYQAATGDMVQADASLRMRTVLDATLTANQPSIVSATANFVNSAYPTGDVGSPVSALGFSPTATILSVTDSSHATASENCGSSNGGTGVVLSIGSSTLPITAPAHGAAAGKVFAVKKRNASSIQVVVQPDAGDTIEGASSYTLGRQNETARFVHDAAANWVLESGYRPQALQRGPIVNFVADSIGPQITNSTGFLNGSGNSGDYLWWAHLISNGKLLQGQIAGIGSTRADQMAARIHATALAVGGHFCGIQTGTNDASLGTAASAYMGYIRQMTAAITAVGQIPILTTPCPVPANSARYLVDQYKRAIVQYAADNGWPLVDFHSLLFDPTTGTYSAAYDSGDHTHPNQAGKQAMGNLIWTTLQNWISPFDSPLEDINTVGSPLGSSSLLANGLFQTDSNSDGIPDGWTKGGTQTYSLVVDAGVSGQAFRIQDTLSSGFSQATTGNLPNTTTGMGGHRIAFTGKVKVDAVTATVGPNLSCALTSPTSGATITLKALAVFTATTPGWQQFYCEGICPSDCNGISVALSSNGGLTIDARCAQLGVYDLTASGL